MKRKCEKSRTLEISIRLSQFILYVYYHKRDNFALS